MSDSAKKAAAPDAEMVQFMADLEQSLQEADAGLGHVTTPAQIVARRRGRPGEPPQGFPNQIKKMYN